MKVVWLNAPTAVSMVLFKRKEKICQYLLMEISVVEKNIEVI